MEPKNLQLATDDGAVGATVVDVKPPAAPGAPPAGRRRSARNRIGWYLIIPALALYAFVILIPAVQGFVYSFTDWNGLSTDYGFIGIDNYRSMLADDKLRATIVRTLVFAVAAAVAQTAIGLALALAVTRRIKGQNSFRLIFFTPVVIVSVVTAFLWRFILAPGPGALNQTLTVLGLGDLARVWLASPTMAAFFIVVVFVWQNAGISMAIYIAGFQSIPPELIEAAEIDGASGFQRFRHVIWPLLAPATRVASLLALIEGLRLFDQIWILTNGGPAGGTETLSIAIYRQTFEYGRFSEGVTMSVTLTLIVALFSVLQYRWGRRGESA